MTCLADGEKWGVFGAIGCRGLRCVQNPGEPSDAEAGPHGAEYLTSRWLEEHLWFFPQFKYVNSFELSSTCVNWFHAPEFHANKFMSEFYGFFRRGTALKHEPVRGCNALVVIRRNRPNARRQRVSLRDHENGLFMKNSF